MHAHSGFFLEHSGASMKAKLQQLFDYFLIGVLGALPVVIIVQVVIYIQSFLKDFFLNIHGKSDNYAITVGLFTLAMLTLSYFGFLIKNNKAHFLYFLEKLLNRVPLLGSLYRVSKKLFSLFANDESGKVKEVVYVEYPRDGIWVPGYVTNRFEDRYVIFVPTSPNPTSGFTIIVHKSKTRSSGMTIEEASSFVISLGVDYAKLEESQQLDQAKN
jgi:uncharacterized membrane protein